MLLGLAITCGAQEVSKEEPASSWIAKLGAEAFVDRERAKLQLVKLGPSALPLLQKAAAEEKDPEIRRSLHTIVQKIFGRSIREIKVIGRHEGGGHHRWVARAVISPDGQHVMTSGHGGVGVWNLKTGKAERNFGKGGSWAMALSPDAKLLTRTTGKMVEIWDWQQGKLVQELPAHTGDVWGVTILPGGKRSVSVGWDSKLTIWDIEKAAELKTVDLPGKGRALALMPDGKLVLIAVFKSKHEPATLHLWDLGKGKAERVFEGHEGSITAVKLSADGKQAVSSSMDKSVRLWNVATGKELRKMTGHSDGVEGATFSPGARYILSCGAEGDPTLRLWDAATGKQIWRSAAFPDGLLSVTFTPDGKHFVVTGKDGTVRLWAFGLGGERRKPAAEKEAAIGRQRH